VLALAGCGGAAVASGGAPAPAKSAPAVQSIPAQSPSAAPASSAPAATTLRFQVQGHKVVAGSRDAQVALGTHVVVEVTADSETELHVHGYDKETDTVPGSVARVEFDATIPGVFDVELHNGVKLCELRVQ
jgi:hypothetical protein